MKLLAATVWLVEVAEVLFIHCGKRVLIVLAAWFLGKARLHSQQQGLKMDIRYRGMDSGVVWWQIWLDLRVRCWSISCNGSEKFWYR